MSQKDALCLLHATFFGSRERTAHPQMQILLILYSKSTLRHHTSKGSFYNGYFGSTKLVINCLLEEEGFNLVVFRIKTAKNY